MIPMLARTRLGMAAARTTMRPPVVLVPTMGALHEGHRALLRRAQEISGPNGSLVVSVFVNPLQFGAGEDLDRYPRDLAADMAVCAEEGATVVFAPSHAQMYPAEMMVTVNPGRIGNVLEGASRPGFFNGVLTVVLKLFNLVGPDVAVFGAKDAQQLALVNRMVADVNLPVRIESVPTVRDQDGLAISSRNRYLSEAERATALTLPRALRAGAAVVSAGPCAVLDAARAELSAAATAEPPLATDYLALADPATFAEIGPGYQGPALLLVAATVGKTRLIDNAHVHFAPLSPGPGP
jgi:pantoate--beta-alanine ligase